LNDYSLGVMRSKLGPDLSGNVYEERLPPKFGRKWKTGALVRRGRLEVFTLHRNIDPASRSIAVFEIDKGRLME
jgi:hypothetical protein